MATRTVMALLALTLVLAVACGSAAPDPTVVPVPTAMQAAATRPSAEPSSAPVVGETSQPTATPQAAAPPADVEVNPGKLTIMVGDLGNERFDFAMTTGKEPLNYGRILHGFLISDNERKEMVPGIASQWGLSDDGLTWTFTIREGVKFHDGSEVTAEDVLWTFQQYWGPQAIEYNTQDQSVTRGMERIELNRPDKVSLTTEIPITHLTNLISEAGVKWYHVMPKRATLGDTEEAVAYDNNPIGAGIMSLEKHVRASVMSFERFDDFYYHPANGFPEDKRVNFRSLDLFAVPEEATRVAALRSGEADIVPASLALKSQVEAGGGRLVFGQEGLSVRIQFIGCYEPQHSCHDKRVRQALGYALDKELMRDRLYGGPEVFQTKGWSGVAPSTIGYTIELDPWPFDLDKARQLLTDAGYPNGEGFGKLIVNTEPSSAMPLQVELAQLAADSWRRELGLDVEVQVSDSVGNRQKQYAGELNGQIYWSDTDPRADASSSIASTYGEPTDYRRYHEDPELFRLVQETLQLLDSDERAEASKKLFLRLRDESYTLGLGYVNIPWAVGPRVETWEPYPMSRYPSALHTITLN